MAASVPSRTGQLDGAGDVDALFLKVFSGEVLAAFVRRNVAMPRSIVRSISSGKSAQFPAHWRAGSSYHVPGAEIVGSAILGNERVITIDGILLSDVFVADIDDAKEHYDVRSIYSAELGYALARQLDTQILGYGMLGADAAATVSGGDAGTEIIDADAKTNADSLVTSIFDAAQALDENDCPPEERTAFVEPSSYYNLIENGTKVIHQDYSGEGSIAGGTLARVAGFEIVPTNNFPGNLSAASATNWPSDLLSDFSMAAALCVHKSAVGTVKLLDLEMQMQWDIRRQGTLLVARMATGSDFLRPEACVNVVTTAFIP